MLGTVGNEGGPMRAWRLVRGDPRPVMGERVVGLKWSRFAEHNAACMALARCSSIYRYTVSGDGPGGGRG